MLTGDVIMKKGEDAILFTRVDYEKKLVELNRHLAEVKSRYGQLEAARNNAKVTLRQAKEWRNDVLSEYQRQNYELDGIIDQCESEKSQLIAQKVTYWDTWDKSYELRVAQYDRALAKITSKMELEDQKWKTMTEERMHRTTLMNKIEVMVDSIKSLKVFKKLGYINGMKSI